MALNITPVEGGIMRISIMFKKEGTRKVVGLEDPLISNLTLTRCLYCWLHRLITIRVSVKVTVVVIHPDSMDKPKDMIDAKYYCTPVLSEKGSLEQLRDEGRSWGTD